jgi:hypothetical protein
MTRLVARACLSIARLLLAPLRWALRVLFGFARGLLDAFAWAANRIAGIFAFVVRPFISFFVWMATVVRSVVVGALRALARVVLVPWRVLVAVTRLIGLMLSAVGTAIWRSCVVAWRGIEPVVRFIGRILAWVVLTPLRIVQDLGRLVLALGVFGARLFVWATRPVGRMVRAAWRTVRRRVRASAGVVRRSVRRAFRTLRASLRGVFSRRR